MKIFISRILLVLFFNSYSHACIDISGKYEIQDFFNFIVEIKQNNCSSSSYTAFSPDGSVIGPTKTMYYDGIMRDEVWPSYERHLGKFIDNYLFEIFHDKDSGRIVDSKTFLEENGNLKSIENHHLPGMKPHRRISYWIKLK